jgi:hypothetical protein
MENDNSKRQVNGKDVNTMSDLIIVEKLDWSKLNPDINEYLHIRLPERKDEEFYFDDRYSGLIEIDKSICLLVTTDVVTREIQILDYMQGFVGFNIGIYVKPKEEGAINTMPEFHFAVIAATELPKIKTGEKLRLPDFMNERYKYNSRISGNEQELIDFLIKRDYKRFPKPNK